MHKPSTWPLITPRQSSRPGFHSRRRGVLYKTWTMQQDVFERCRRLCWRNGQRWVVPSLAASSLCDPTSSGCTFIQDANKAARAQAQVQAELAAQTPVSELPIPTTAQDVEMTDLDQVAKAEGTIPDPTNTKKRKAEEENGNDAKKTRPGLDIAVPAFHVWR